MSEVQQNGVDPSLGLKKSFFWGLWVFFFAAAVIVPGATYRKLWNSEGRWANISRNMLRSGNYFEARINGQARYTKPLLSYWMIVISAKALGGLNEFSLRLPFLLTGLLGVVLAYLFGCLLFDTFTGVLASLILATSYGWNFYSRVIQADTPTVFGISLALFSFYLGYRYRRKLPFFFFWIMAALSCHLKGLQGFAIPVGVAVSFVWLEHYCSLSQMPTSSKIWLSCKNTLRFFGKPVHITGGIAGVFLYLLPYFFYPAGVSTGLWFVYRENILRFLQPFDHRGNMFTYAKALPVLFAPWVVFLIFGCIKVRGRIFHTPSLRFVMVWIVVTFLLFQSSGSKRSYYILPILIPLALLTGYLWGRIWKESLTCLEHWLALLPPAILWLGGVLLLSRCFDFLPHPKLLSLLLFCGGIGVYLFHKKSLKYSTIFQTYLALTIGFYVFFWGVFGRSIENYRPLSVFYRGIQKELALPPHPALALYKAKAPEIHLFYLDPQIPAPYYHHSTDALQFLSGDKPKFLFTPLPHFWKFAQLASQHHQTLYWYLPASYRFTPFQTKTFRKFLVLLSNSPLPLKDSSKQ
ncbi:MAG: phospholipid carrier-dependent glycosyltransferase [Planctomycetota bacterium]|nr:MAG: phospholipid carrier-dependent glycosyltransferase [Planctomycetota bacterium]